jgi:alkylation response protein AidB-like acyl-CoA dehydrogenase
MPTYKAPLDDIHFILNEVLNAGQLTAYFPDFDLGTMSAVLEEGAKLCEEVLQPINRSGDEEGCVWNNGAVTTPKGFKEAYKMFCEAGWPALGCDPAYGGQGLPHAVNTVFEELICSANLSFGMYPGLSRGAYDALMQWGSDELKKTYLPKLVSGEWSGTMCLTEPHCGTDLGLIRTKAIPNANGSFKVTGTKIFISAGEHDLTNNIIHLVLAKLPDAPPGTRGISLFIVPKFIPKADNTPGERNKVVCGSIEHKMGIKASSTCVMNFDEAQGWLVGEPHKGMKAMFTMMNAARLAVGIQGLGLAEVSYQNAAAYAADRLQGRSLTGTKFPDKPADPILVHPDVRKNLLTLKANIEGSRALAYWMAMQIDISHTHPDPKVRQKADDFVALLTPIAKSYFTDMAYEGCTMGQQVLGGHGYIREWGLEQFVRDARIAQIYEGTNGIQALDLVGRKLPLDMGRLLRSFFHPMGAELEAEAANPALMEFVVPLTKAFAKLQQTTALIAQKGMKNPDEAGAASTDYLRMFALVALGWMWLKMAKVAQAKLPTAGGQAPFYDAKVKLARFFFQKLLPSTDTLAKTIGAGAAPLMETGFEQFALPPLGIGRGAA